MTNDPDIWVLADDRAGNRSQAVGVAEALGRPFRVVDIEYGPWARLPNAFLGGSTLGLTAAARTLINPPWPNLIIGAGRRTAPIARAIKRKSAGLSRLVQVMHPGAGSEDFDLIAVPMHDPGIAAENTISIVGAPHGLSVEKLKDARDKWLLSFEGLSSPRIAVMVGGSTRRRKFTAAMAQQLGAGVSRMAAGCGGSLMVSTSRRTGNAADTLVSSIDAPAQIFQWGDPGENPYAGFLACADYVVVTGDSVSMCSEACAVPVPVQIFAPPALITPKHARCHASLYEKGYARPFSGGLESHEHPCLNAADEIAAAIHERIF
jgi:uncharacterized protein